MQKLYQQLSVRSNGKSRFAVVNAGNRLTEWLRKEEAEELAGRLGEIYRIR